MPEHMKYAFRKRETDTLSNWILSGRYCAVVAPSNMGKSFLLRRQLPPAIAYYASAAGKISPTIIFVDALMAGDTEASFYELILSQLLIHIADIEELAELHEEIQSKYDQAIRSNSPIALKAALIFAIRTIVRQNDIHLVLVFDEMDQALLSLPPTPFRTLRSLRDEFRRKQLSYIVATSKRLERIQPSAAYYEFREMFLTHTLMLKPLQPEERLSCLGDLIQRDGRSINRSRQELTVSLSGGHPGLMKRIYYILFDHPPVPNVTPEIIALQLLKIPIIQEECQRLWSELEIEEKEGMLGWVLSGKDALDDAKYQALLSKGILVEAQGKDKVFSILFESFVHKRRANLLSEGKEGIRCELDTGLIFLNGQDITLEFRSDQQRKLLRHLYQHRNQVCTYDEIIDAVYGVGEGVAPGAIYQLCKRLREKIEIDHQNPQYLITVPNEGVLLRTPDD